MSTFQFVTKSPSHGSISVLSLHDRKLPRQSKDDPKMRRQKKRFKSSMPLQNATYLQPTDTLGSDFPSHNL